MIKKPVFSVFLLAALTISSCADVSGDPSDITPDKNTGADSTAAMTAEAYPYELPDLGGYTLRVFNMETLWNMYIDVDTDATNGEILNDTVYNRNRKAEQALNFKLEEITSIEEDITVHNQQIKESILSADDLYDVVYASIKYTPAMLTDGYFMNLLDIDGLNLQEDWWDSVVADNATINGCLYTATSPMHLMPYDSAWILFFNRNMMEQNDMELPYDLVREGKWTIEALLGYTKAIANLNGDASFVWNKDGNCIYGMSAHSNAGEHFITAAGESFVSNDADGNIAFRADSNRFFNVITKLAGLFDTSAGYSLAANTDDFNADLGGYMHVFHSGRSLFLTAEIKAAQLLRDMEASFGLVPIPKYDESQENYRCDFVNACLFYTIPITNTHLTETAAASDYLSYLSSREVIPLYYENVVEQKGLRDEDSIEMLDIVLSNKTVDLGNLFGWSASLFEAIRGKLFAGSDAVASLVERHKKTIQKSIDNTLEAIEITKSNS
ncbi:MAG: hypothetical protein E7604_14305 [Ruminococcaceae bacterium]|nr:hypothetical protein [Oscillospiraceae bacterium]